jgi:hypothetical protein
LAIKDVFAMLAVGSEVVMLPDSEDLIMDVG